MLPHRGPSLSPLEGGEGRSRRVVAPRVDPVRSDEVLPARADVVVIGGGIIGASAALFLAQKGVRVVPCEKGHIAGELSSRNWGWWRKMGRDPREHAQLRPTPTPPREYQLDTRILTRAEAAEPMPGLTGNWTGALYTASDGKAEPQRAAPAIAEAA